MSVARVTEITAGSSKSFEDAVNKGLKRANETLDHIEGARVERVVNGSNIFKLHLSEADPRMVRRKLAEVEVAVPNPAAGFQVVEVKKPRPNSRMAGQEKNTTVPAIVRSKIQMDPAVACVASISIRSRRRSVAVVCRVRVSVSLIAVTLVSIDSAKISPLQYA